MKFQTLVIDGKPYVVEVIEQVTKSVYLAHEIKITLCRYIASDGQVRYEVVLEDPKKGSK